MDPVSVVSDYYHLLLKPVEATTKTKNNALKYKLRLSNTEREELPETVPEHYKPINLYV